jgi:hypothetical protein
MSTNTSIETVADAEYTNQLHQMEAQLKQTETILTGSPRDRGCVGEVCCAKMCIAFVSSAFLSIFAICDVYYGATDITCVSQSQAIHHLNITLKSYLLASGIIMFSFIGLLNVAIFLFDVSPFEGNTRRDTNDSGVAVGAIICRWFLNGFGLSWLILGCVLFWAYTDIDTCDQSVHDYLFARFIIGIVMTAGSVCSRAKE